MLSASKSNEATTYIAFVGKLREQFKTQFPDLHANNQVFALFAVNMDSVAIHLQMELTDLHCNTDLKTKFTEVVIFTFTANMFQLTNYPD